MEREKILLAVVSMGASELNTREFIWRDGMEQRKTSAGIEGVGVGVGNCIPNTTGTEPRCSDCNFPTGLR
jgi:hypothetical protein